MKSNVLTDVNRFYSLLGVGSGMLRLIHLISNCIKTRPDNTYDREHTLHRLNGASIEVSEWINVGWLAHSPWRQSHKKHSAQWTVRTTEHIKSWRQRRHFMGMTETNVQSACVHAHVARNFFVWTYIGEKWFSDCRIAHAMRNARWIDPNVCIYIFYLSQNSHCGRRLPLKVIRTEYPIIIIVLIPQCHGK